MENIQWDGDDAFWVIRKRTDLGMNEPGRNSAAMTNEFCSVFEFARRYRLTVREQNRLLMLFGPVARAEDLLSNATRNQLIG